MSRIPLAAVALLPTIAASGQVRISEVWSLAGQSAQAPNANYVELFNAGTEPQSLDGWSIQINSFHWYRIELAGEIQPRGYFLVRVTNPQSPGIPLPEPDALAGHPTYIMSANFIVALMSTNPDLQDCPTGDDLMDLVTSGVEWCYEGSPSMLGASADPPLSLTRRCTERDTNNNKADFEQRPPSPANSATPPLDSAVEVTLTPGMPTPPIRVGKSAILTVRVEPCMGTSTNGHVVVDLTQTGGAARQPMLDDGVYPDAMAGDGVFTTITHEILVPRRYEFPFVFRDEQGREAGSVFLMPVRCAGDVVGDGDTDRKDLGTLIARFGCCEEQACWDEETNLAEGPSGACGGAEGIDQADLGTLLADWRCEPLP